MPKQFFYRNLATGHQWSGIVQTRKCEYQGGCNRDATIGAPLCWQHNKIEYHLRIGPSPVAGKGVFAVRPNNAWPLNKPVIQKGETCCYYYGELIDEDELQERYDGSVGIYVVEVKQQPPMYEDGALLRGLGSMINHQPTAQANCRFGRYFDYDAGQSYTVVKATKNIYDGQELFADYGPEYVMPGANNIQYGDRDIPEGI